MITQNVIQNKQAQQKSTQHLQQLLASIIPVAVILLIGAYGSQNMQEENSIIFTGIFLLAAIVTFAGEYQVIALMHNARSKQYAELTTVCQEFLAGNQTVKATVREKNELATLAEAINQLLEQQRQLQQSVNAHPPAKAAATNAQMQESQLIKRQLQRIITDLKPMANGDLRVRTALAGGVVGAIADTCNSLVEELAQFVKWTRYASQVVITTSGGVLARSLELTKNTETQIHSISNATHNIEEIVAYMQHLSNTLHLSFDISKEIQGNVQDTLQTNQATDTPILQLMNEMQRQTNLLGGLLDGAEKTSTLAESLIDELYTVAQQIYQSSVSLLKTIERLSELEVLAQGWSNATSSLMIEEDKPENTY
jgi:methyl-accepting chemotaxis protein